MNDIRKAYEIYYTTEDVAKLEDVHEETVRRWVREGILPVSRFRGPQNRNLITKEDYAIFKQHKERIHLSKKIQKKIEELLLEITQALQKEHIFPEEQRHVLKSFEKSLLSYREKL